MMSNRKPGVGRTSVTRDANRRLVRRLALMAVCMFGFGFALVPLYTVFCQITGLQGRGVTVDPARPGVTVTDSNRAVRVRFLATTQSSLPWRFQPGEKSKTVRLGELSQTRFFALNAAEESITGHATFNVVPPEASLYFVKTECFCFTQQRLAGQESREMPVYFYIQPDLPGHIREVTLAYTFYRNDGTGAAMPSPAAANAYP